MELDQIQTIQDAVTYFREHPIDAQPTPDASITLTAPYAGDLPEGTLRWDIWRRDYTRNERYPFIDGQPKLMLYEQKRVDGPLYTSGIVFSLDIPDVIQQVVLNADTLTITVNAKAFFWYYDRNQGVSVRSLFSQYNPGDFEIDDVVTIHMDTQTPQHTSSSLIDPTDV